VISPSPPWFPVKESGGLPVHIEDLHTALSSPHTRVFLCLFFIKTKDSENSLPFEAIRRIGYKVFSESYDVKSIDSITY